MTDTELIRACLEIAGSAQRLADGVGGFGERIVLRWLNGQNEVPPGVWGDITRWLGKYQNRILQLQTEIKRKT